MSQKEIRDIITRLVDDYNESIGHKRYESRGIWKYTEQNVSDLKEQITHDEICSKENLALSENQQQIDTGQEESVTGSAKDALELEILKKQHSEFATETKYNTADYAHIIVENDHDLKEQADNMIQNPGRFGIKLKCALSMTEYWGKGEEYLPSVKVFGKDEWSSKDLSAVLEITGEKDLDTAMMYLEDEKDALAALRWHCRGLSLRDSIIHMMLDRESISAKKIKFRKNGKRKRDEQMQIDYDKLFN